MQDEVLYKQLGRKLFIKLNPDEDDLDVVITDCCKIDEFIYIKGFIDKENLLFDTFFSHDKIRLM